MLASPILQRELRTCLRRRDFHRLRTIGVYWATGIGAFLLLLDFFGVPALGFAGFWLFVATALLAAIHPIAFCLGWIQEEREAQTFPLLHLAGVGAFEFFFSKAAGAVWVSAYQLLGLIPLLSLPFLSGGLSFAAFVAMLAFLPAVLIASTGLTLLASTLFRDETAARSFLYTTVGAWAFAGLFVQALGRMATGSAPFGDEILWTSPIHAASLLSGTAGRPQLDSVYHCIALMWGVGLTSMAGAAAWLRWTWNRVDPAATANRPVRTRLQEPTEPGAIAHWNPVSAWVAGDRRRLRWSYLSLAIIAAGWTLAASAWGKAWMNSLMCLLVMFVVCTISASLPSVLLAAKVSRERRNGAFNELLGTPVSPESIVDGHVLGTLQLTRRFRITSGAICGVVWCAGLLARDWIPLAFVSYAIIGGTLLAFTLSPGSKGLYVTFRRAFVTGRFGASFGSGARSALLGNLYNIINMYRFFRAMLRTGKLPDFPSGGNLEFAIVLAVAAVVLLVWRGIAFGQSPTRAMMIGEMRQLAEEPPLPDDDPRLKGWDGSTSIL